MLRNRIISEYNSDLKNDTRTTHMDEKKAMTVIDISHTFCIPLASFNWIKYSMGDFIRKCKIFDCEKLESIAFPCGLLNRKKVRLMFKIDRHSA